MVKDKLQNVILKSILFLCVLILFTSLTLKSQETGVMPKSFIGGTITTENTNSNYGENNLGAEIFFRHNLFFKNNHDYFSINANYLNYKYGDISKEDYLVTLGYLRISDPLTNLPEFVISYYFGVDFGMLYKDNGLYYGALDWNTGFIWNLPMNFNFEVGFKIKYNPTDEIHVGGRIGLSYSF